jgi:membrane protein YfhO
MPRVTAFGRQHPDLAIVVLLALLPLLVLGRALVPGKTLSAADNLVLFTPWAALAPRVAPANPLLLDITFLFHPSVLYGAEAIRAGRFPLWNPHVFGGVPFFANPQTALLFPLTALAYILPPALALTLMSVLKLSVAGAGMYWFLRLLDVGRGPALLGALAFQFNALVVTWLQWSNTGPVVLLPVLFALTELVRARAAVRPVAGLALAVALAVFAGYPQRVVYALPLLALWAVYRDWGFVRPVGFLARWVAGVALGLLLSAVQLLPFAEYARASAVLAYRQEWMLYFPLPPRAVIALLMPDFFGSPARGDFWGPANFNEIALSVGVVPWLALPLALAAAWARPGTKYFAGLAAFAGALVYGAPLVGSTIAGLPPLSTTLVVRTADLLVFALPVLGALGLDAIRAAPPAALRRAPAAVRLAFAGLSLGALGFVWSNWTLAARAEMRVPLWVQYAWFLLLLTLAAVLVLRLLRAAGAGPPVWAALAAVELASLAPVAVTYNPVIDTRLLYPGPPPVVAHLRERTARDHARVFFTGLGAANFGTIFRLDEFGGYDGMTPRRVEQLADPVGSLDTAASGAFRVTAPVTSAVFDLLGIRYLMLAPGAPSPAAHLVRDYDGPDATVYRNDRALPRAFLVSRARTCLDDAAALRLLHDGALDPRQEVLIAGCDGAPPGGAGAGAAGSAEIESYAPERVVIDATAGAPAYLVLTDAWFPGWRAWVDGAEQPVWRANHALRAVWLQPGRHRVVFRYEPASFRIGLLVSVLAALAVAALLVASARRRSAGAALAAALIVWPAAADAKLPAAPFTLDVTPSSLAEGENLVLRVDPAGAMTQLSREPLDVYLSAVRDGARGWLYIVPAGAPSLTPAAFARATSDRPFVGLLVTLRGVEPGGWYMFRVQFVSASAEQPTRKHYVFQPLLATVRVEPRRAGDSSAALVALGLLTLAALAVTWLTPARPARDGPGG